MGSEGGGAMELCKEGDRKVVDGGKEVGSLGREVVR